MELGKIYKIEQKENTFTGIVVQIKETSGRIYVYTTTGELREFRKEDPPVFKTPRLKADVRKGLQVLYKLHCERLRLVEKRNQLDIDAREHQRLVDEAKKSIKTYSNEFNLSDLAAEFQGISGYSTDPLNPTISFYIEKMVGKHMTPDNYSFLDREYDGSVYVYDQEASIKQFGVQISLNEIEGLKKQLSHTSLLEVTDEADIGDKSSLWITKIFTFKIKKRTTYSEIKEECTRIQNWISQFAN